MNILVFGGAGFIGSNIANYLADCYSSITVIDGLLKGTGGLAKNISNKQNITFIDCRIEDLENLREIIYSHELILDCMGWTSHLDAFDDPFYDIELNLSSHLFLIRHLKPTNTVIYLGSIGQFGETNTVDFESNSAMNPTDIQGVHKTAVEQYLKIYSKRNGFNAVSLRIPNVFGINQKVTGADIGLVGSLIRSAIIDKSIDVYGSNRWRSILHISDLTLIIAELIKKNNLLKGFHTFNVGGHHILISELASEIKKILPKTNVNSIELPQKIAEMDTGGKKINDSCFKQSIFPYQLSPLHVTLNETINYFTKAL